MARRLRIKRAILGILTTVSCGGRAFGEPPAQGPTPARQWALIIAVGKYTETVPELKFTLKDARLFEQTVRDECLVEKDHILAMTEESPPEYQPTLANIRREMPQFLARLRANDRLFVFFSGHGLARDNKTFLMPADYRRAAAVESTYPLAELRDELARCAAKFKMLVLDCCNSGGKPGENALDPQVQFARLVAPRENPGLVVFASCKIVEKSYEWPKQKDWPERPHGIFTYWFCKAMAGDAEDADDDGQLSVDELFRFTSRKVQITARSELLEQTPDCLGDVDGVPPVVSVRHSTPKALMTRFARELAPALRAHRAGRVLIGEFYEKTGSRLALVAAPLPAYCALTLRDELKRQLEDDPAPGPVPTILNRDFPKGFEPTELTLAAGLKSLPQAMEDVDTVILGVLDFDKQVPRVKCDLVRLNDGRVLASSAGLLTLDENTLIHLGTSFDVSSHKALAIRPRAELSDILLSEAQKPNPLTREQKALKFPIELWAVKPKLGAPIDANAQRRKLELREIALGAIGEIPRRHVAAVARSDEFLEIRVRNKHSNRVRLTLLIDGRNALDGMPDSPGKSRYRILEPPMNGNDNPLVIEGWHAPGLGENDPGLNGERLTRRCSFADAGSSVSTERLAGEPLGLITAIFRTDPIGGIEGDTGSILAAIHIRYVAQTGVLIPPAGDSAP